jgi:hypothetical protein
MFYHRVTNYDPSCWVVGLKGGTTWAVITAITAVNERKPIHDVYITSCDKLSACIFPSVYDKVNGALLLSQSLDDPASENDFAPPSGVTILGFLRVEEDVSFAFWLLMCVVHYLLSRSVVLMVFFCLNLS